MRVGLDVGTGVPVALGIGVGDAAGFGVLEGVRVAVAVGEAVAVLVAGSAVPVGAIGVAVSVAIGGVGEAVTTGVAGVTGVGVAEAVGVREATGLGMLAGAVGGSLKQPVARKRPQRHDRTIGRQAIFATFMALPARGSTARFRPDVASPETSSPFRSDDQDIRQPGARLLDAFAKISPGTAGPSRR
ncbi:MAG: hypothetical protein ABR610_02140 [Thermoanaerobaculia bacterium]